MYLRHILICLLLSFDLFSYVFPQGFTCDDWEELPEMAPACEGWDPHSCFERNCTWCPHHPFPWCFIGTPPPPTGYKMVGEPVDTHNGMMVFLQIEKNPREEKPLWREDEAESLVLIASFQSDYRLRVHITDVIPRWEVPLEINPPSSEPNNLLYEMQFVNNPLFSFKVIRKSSGAVLFESGIGRFAFASQYISIGWKLPSENVYGIGENEQRSFKHNFNEATSWPLYARDQPPSHTVNMYGVQPYYTVLENDGNAHSVALINSNAQEWTFSRKEGQASVRYTTIGGLLDFYFFLGPTPEETVQQYTEAVGRAQMPPYWALGFQLCRYGYNNIQNMKNAVERTAQYGIPHDVQYGDIDIMERALDFTYSEDRFPGLPEYIKELKARGIKFMTILDPCISIGEPPGTYRPYELGNQMDVWYKRADGSNAIGRVWPEDPIYFPDYSKNSTKEWWITLIKEFHDLLEYDGLWIDMNEPANFVYGDLEGCENNKWNNPPYKPGIAGNLPDKTICADHQDSVSQHYNTHSLYGFFQSEPTLIGTRAGTQKRSLVLSRSTFLGSGKWVAHWLGDNFSQWSNLHYSIIGMLQFNHFGIPFVGADICGFIGDANPQICQRWMQLGAFYPFARNHNGINYQEQDPGFFGPEIAESSRKALYVRYTLLPYMYTQFYHHNTKGSTVVRALWHEFPMDTETHNIDRQFLWGNSVLVSPVLYEQDTHVNAYFPNARFFSYYTGEEISVREDWTYLDAPMDFIPVHIRGGSIIPTQEPDINTELSRNHPFGLIVAINDAGEASGNLFFDDGDSIDTVEKGQYFYAEYFLSGRSLQVNVIQNGYPDMGNKIFGSIRLLGAGSVSIIIVNGASHSDFEIKPSGEVFITNLNLAANQIFTLNYN